jgi:hypothetical protein
MRLLAGLVKKVVCGHSFAESTVLFSNIVSNIDDLKYLVYALYWPVINNKYIPWFINLIATSSEDPLVCDFIPYAG